MLVQHDTHVLFFVFCLQCAGRASTNLCSGIWSVQSVHLIVSLTMRDRCTVAVRKITSVLRETPPLWPVPVSVHVCVPSCVYTVSSKVGFDIKSYDAPLLMLVLYQIS